MYLTDGFILEYTYQITLNSNNIVFHKPKYLILKSEYYYPEFINYQ